VTETDIGGDLPTHETSTDAAAHGRILQFATAQISNDHPADLPECHAAFRPVVRGAWPSRAAVGMNLSTLRPSSRNCTATSLSDGQVALATLRILFNWLLTGHVIEQRAAFT
jgi:hypothetical protein